MSEAPKHYMTIYKRKLTPAECEAGEVLIVMDPYRVSKLFNISGGAREQILKKCLRWTSKGHTEGVVCHEIISAARRHLEILREDNPEKKESEL
jgi:hypothetical protein